MKTFSVSLLFAVAVKPAHETAENCRIMDCRFTGGIVALLTLVCRVGSFVLCSLTFLHVALVDIHYTADYAGWISFLPHLSAVFPFSSSLERLIAQITFSEIFTGQSSQLFTRHTTSLSCKPMGHISQNDKNRDNFCMAHGLWPHPGDARSTQLLSGHCVLHARCSLITARCTLLNARSHLFSHNLGGGAVEDGGVAVAALLLPSGRCHHHRTGYTAQQPDL